MCVRRAHAAHLFNTPSFFFFFPQWLSTLELQWMHPNETRSGAMLGSAALFVMGANMGGKSGCISAWKDMAVIQSGLALLPGAPFSAAAERR